MYGMTRLASEAGRIEKVSSSAVSVRMDDTRRLTLRRSGRPVSNGATDQSYWRLAERRTGRLYPDGYVPADPKRSLLGRRITVETYRMNSH